MRALVTGGTGFLGSWLARALADDGHDVVVFGRNLYATSRIFHPKIRRVRGDLGDAAAVDAAVASAGGAGGCDVVFHSGALSSPWGTRAQFERANVDGTQNVVDACVKHKVRRLVHVSTTALHFEKRDKRGVKESDPLPARFVNDYARTKHAAEQIVQRAVADAGLDAVIVRARAIIGPGDTTLLPRLLDAARAGRLRQIGGGDNALDLTWVGNLVDALVLAVDKGAAGEVFTVTNDDPRPIWPLLRDVLRQAGIEHTLKPVSADVVDAFAAVVEGVHRAVPALGEPTLTRYGASLLARTQTFDIEKAKTTLGYRPRVALDDAIAQTLRQLTQTNEAPASTSVTLRLLFTGFTEGYEHHVLSGARREIVPFHSMVAVVEHPRFGVTLFDSGYSRHFHEHTRAFPFNLYAKVTPVTCAPEDEVKTQLAALGVDRVDRLVLSHFHGDHIAGVRDFAGADVIAHKDGVDDAKDRAGDRVNAVRKGFVPALLDDGFFDRVYALADFNDEGFGVFDRVHDLFGDRSVLLVELPGHAAGQIGMLVQLAPGVRKLLVADAVWYRRAIVEQRMPGLVTYPLFSSTKKYRQTLTKLGAFARAFPDIELLPTHCPEVFAQYAPLKGAPVG